MPSSSTSIFSEPDEFVAALRVQTSVDLLVTGQGRFCARLTQVRLHRLHLAVGDETVSRIAFMAIRPDLTLVWWMIGQHSSLIWCGTPAVADELMILHPGNRAHARTEGASRWAALWISAADLADCAQALTGQPIMVSVGAISWRASPAALRTLCALHAAAIEAFENRPAEVLGAGAVRGLEQQLIHALVDCLSHGAPSFHSETTGAKSNGMMASFEDVCAAYVDRMPTLAELCTALGIREQSLRASCNQYFGMGPMDYIRLRRMHSVRRALRLARPSDSTVSGIAARHGFTEPGRFAARYRRLFGEPPSATLQRTIVAI